MPIATIHIVEGRDMEKKRRLIAAVSEAIAISLDAPPASIRVLIQEVPAELWGVGQQTVAERRAARASDDGSNKV
jgi:4-oxalocrotonate tautomerase